MKYPTPILGISLTWISKVAHLKVISMDFCVPLSAICPTFYEQSVKVACGEK